MDFAIYKFPYGFLKIGYQGETLKLLQRADKTSDNDKKTDFTDLVYKEIMEYLNGERTTFDFPYELEGTDFQKKVWKELTRIPYGEIRTYKDIASAIGNKNASRAVGMANNKNPIMILVPCHRVIGANGKLVGYAGGLDMKKGLLDLESRVREIPYLEGQACN
ncbi:methylated-DNA--[protein]-cysteine S-methyltransferase [Helcococcus massiliensis]|uniref:methylated-DNA--[protein]-cysteine S-methyltransferase n=1 Tax=Helcococcus massiliensis TaxID=2040290 RepID=UPI000CDF28DB|nr:methylated-DNA--[protein]-cysteine S-methyltransferase [Helcococcus massiliensis]